MAKRRGTIRVFLPVRLAAKPKRFIIVMERLVLPRLLLLSFAKRSCRGRAVSFIIEFVFPLPMRITQWAFYSSARQQGIRAAWEGPLNFLSDLKNHVARASRNTAGAILLTGSHAAV